MSARIGVVVVAYRSADLIDQCLKSVLVDENTHVVVVDNSSEEQCMRRVRAFSEQFPGRVDYLDPQENLGYARGNNLGAAHLPSDIDYITILNPDVQLTRLLGEAIEEYAASPWDILAGGLTDADGRVTNARPMATVFGELKKALVGSRAYRFSPTKSDLQRVGQLDGALLVLRQETWSKLGGFDEQFELYYEDVDLCRRANFGIGCWLALPNWGRHMGGASFQQSSDRAFAALRISRIRYLRKISPRGGTMISLLITAMEILSRSITRCPEGSTVRRLSLIASWKELQTPKSVFILETSPHADITD